MAEAFEKVDLPSGGWVAIRDPEQTTEAQRRPVKRMAMRAAGSGIFDALEGKRPIDDLSDAQIDALWDFNDALAVALIDSWSFDEPTTLEGLKGLTGKGDYDAVIAAAVKHRDALMPDFGPDPAPDSPTVASDGSSAASGADPSDVTSKPPTKRASQARASQTTTGAPTS